MALLDHESLQDVCVFYAENEACSSCTAREAVPGDEVSATNWIGIGFLPAFCCVA